VSCNGRCWYTYYTVTWYTYFTAIWCSMWPFGIFYGYFPLWYVVPREIWQPCLHVILFKDLISLRATCSSTLFKVSGLTNWDLFTLFYNPLSAQPLRIPYVHTYTNRNHFGGKLRVILNFTPGPEGWTWPPGVKFVPQEECSPLHSPPGVNTLYCLEEWRGKQRISPPGDNFTPRGQNSPLGDKIHPWGTTSPLRVKVRP
jgi:hypothetical protein